MFMFDKLLTELSDLTLAEMSSAIFDERRRRATYLPPPTEEEWEIFDLKGACVAFVRYRDRLNSDPMRKGIRPVSLVDAKHRFEGRPGV